ncbi:MAG: site-specific integrase [Alphaproteobacteria bacterium]|nr:site-specific integrase [Alphaproteobacteria bacterium]
MASIRKRNGLWQVQVRSRNIGSTTKSFHRKADAEYWAKEQEALMQSGQWHKASYCNLTIRDMVEEYSKRVTPQKRGKETELRRLRRLLGEKDLMSIRLEDALPPIFASFRDRRLSDGVRACQYDLVLLRHAWNMARIEWGWPIGDNPLSLIRMPKNNPPRERRLRPGEYQLLKTEVQGSRCWYLWPIIDIAIETAMRRGEILGLKWEDIDWTKNQVLLPLTKNGRSRWVPLSSLAIEHLRPVPQTSNLVFPVTDVAFRQAWDRLRSRAGINDLTFHDLRHEAISRMFESGMKIHEVMAVSGHRTASQLFRYTHPI